MLTQTKRRKKMMDSKGIELLETLIFKLTNELIVAKDVFADALYKFQDLSDANGEAVFAGCGEAFKAMNKAEKEVKSLESAIALHRETIELSA